MNSSCIRLKAAVAVSASLCSLSVASSPSLNHSSGCYELGGSFNYGNFALGDGNRGCIIPPSTIASRSFASTSPPNLIPLYDATTFLNASLSHSFAGNCFRVDFVSDTKSSNTSIIGVVASLSSLEQNNPPLPIRFEIGTGTQETLWLDLDLQVQYVYSKGTLDGADDNPEVRYRIMDAFGHVVSQGVATCSSADVVCGTGLSVEVAGIEPLTIEFQFDGALDGDGAADPLNPHTLIFDWQASAPSAPCRADLTGLDGKPDRIVNGTDYFEFLDLFDSMDLRADFNNDGVLSGADFLEFLQEYQAGCVVSPCL